jgi:flagellar biosynthesis protein FlhG
MRRAACPVVAITSGKGGVGKTSLCVNLAIALADQGLRITVLDADLGLANADVLLGLAATTRLDAAIEWTPGTRARPLESIAIEAPGGFRLIPGASGQARMASLTSAQRCGLLRSIADLDRTSDLILIDTGAGLSAGVTNFLEVADLTIVVATPEPTSITDAYAVIKCVGPLLRSRPQRFATPLFLVANQVKDQAEANAVIGRIDATARRFLAGVLSPTSLGSLGMVRFDAAVPKAVRARTPVQISTPKCMASRDIADLADRLAHTVGVARTQQAPQPRSFLSRLFRGSSQD